MFNALLGPTRRTLARDRRSLCLVTPAGNMIADSRTCKEILIRGLPASGMVEHMRCARPTMEDRL